MKRQMIGLMDEHILEEPTAGVLTMQSMLKDNGYHAGYERVRRLMLNIPMAHGFMYMTGKGRAVDNIYIEGFWGTLKYQYVYLNPADNGLQLHQGIDNWINHCHSRDHQGIGRTKPCFLHKKLL